MTKGKHLSEETKKKLSEARLGKYVGEKSGSWKGGRVTSTNGYILIKKRSHPNADSNGYVKEHRLIVEKCLGRYLTKTEIVHHINRKRDDNRKENLYLFSTTGDHTSFHRKILKIKSKI